MRIWWGVVEATTVCIYLPQYLEETLKFRANPVDQCAVSLWQMACS